MASNDRLPSELDCTNLANEWPDWKRNFLVYMIASGKDKGPEDTKIANLIWLIGSDGANIYNTLFPNDGTKNSLLGTITVGTNVTQRTLNDVLLKFDGHCLPQRNIAMESYKFNVISQKEGQSFMEFETELRTQLRYCAYKCECGKLYEDRMLRDRIIVGVHDKKLQLKLLDGRDEQLSRVIEICKTHEAANSNKSVLDAKQPVVYALKTDDHTKPVTKVCFNCGGSWTASHVKECRAKDATCYFCQKKGHFQRMCRKPKKPSTGNDTASAKPKVAELNWSDVVKYNSSGD